MKKIQQKLLTSKHISALIIMSSFSILLGLTYFFASDMYVPSMPDIAKHFATNSSITRLTISFFLLSLAFSQLIYGPISDKIGRKKVILFGSVIYIIGSIVCLNAPDIDSLLLGRIIQGAGVGALMSLSRTIIQDITSKEDFLKIVSWLSLFFMIAPASAPILGGYLQEAYGWSGSFIFMTILGLVVLGLMFIFLPETNKNKNEHALEVKVIANNYGSMLSNSEFLAYVVCMIVGLSGIVVFYTIGPFLLINDHGFTPVEFGWISLLIIGFVILARAYGSFFLFGKLKPCNIILIGMSILAISVIILLSLTLLGINSSWMLIGSICIFAFGSGLFVPVAAASALSLFSHIAGTVGAMYGFLQMGGLFLTSGLAALLIPSQLTLALILFVLVFLAFGYYLYVFFIKNTQKQLILTKNISSTTFNKC